MEFLNNIDPNLWGIIIAIIVIWKGMDFLKGFMMSKKNGKSEHLINDEVKELIISLRQVLQEFIITITKNNEKIEVMNDKLDKVHSSSLQAVTIMAEGSDSMKDKVKEIQNELDKIHEKVR